MSVEAHPTVVAVGIQELTELGSEIDLGVIRGDELKFLHQAFITDSVASALGTPEVDVRLYHIDSPERLRLIQIVTEYMSTHLKGDRKTAFDERFSTHQLEPEPFGTRIDRIFEDCFASGYSNVLFVGSRTPTFTPDMLTRAIKILEESDAVFGPTPEGRYYTLGMSGSYQVRLSDFDWQAPNLYSKVADAFAAKGLRWSELEIWYTVENSDALEMMARDINQFRFEGDVKTAKETEVVMERLIANL